tara:strand:+ start:405 stop:881 length:477 start_codon:yes stop_codon:yes gene_type:complete
MRRIVLKKGDIFECKYGSKKRYFQYIVTDRTCLDGDVIRCFETEYEIGETPELQKIVTDNILIWLQTSIYAGRHFNLWERVGNIPSSDVELPFFRATNDAGAEVEISDKWHIWKPNEEKKLIGFLPKQMRLYPKAGVIHPLSVPEILQSGINDFKVPN